MSYSKSKFKPVKSTLFYFSAEYIFNKSSKKEPTQKLIIYYQDDNYCCTYTGNLERGQKNYNEHDYCTF